MKMKILVLLILPLLISCKKKENSQNETKSYEYWNNLVNEKRGEINTLVQSVPCSTIEEFEIIKKGGYYLVHPSIRAGFDKLQVELEQLQKEMNIAYAREGWIGGPVPTIPNHPVRKVCENGKPKLMYVGDLSMEEIYAQLPVRYKEIKAFYKDLTCTDASQWIGHYIFSDCKAEAVAVHKTVRHEEIREKMDIYNLMMIRKIRSEKLDCSGLQLNRLFSTKPVECKDGEPVVIEE